MWVPRCTAKTHAPRSAASPRRPRPGGTNPNPNPNPAPALRWDLDEAAIFAQTDAFVQRCRDLLEVCRGQVQFCRRREALGGAPGPLPEFGGTRGQEVAKALLQVQAAFDVRVQRLRGLDYDALDVKTARWHDDYNAFKNVVKDLEVMYTNVVNNIAFEGVRRVPDCVALLEMFHALAVRPAVKRCVEKRVTETLRLFKVGGGGKRAWLSQRGDEDDEDVVGCGWMRLDAVASLAFQSASGTNQQNHHPAHTHRPSFQS